MTKMKLIEGHTLLNITRNKRGDEKSHLVVFDNGCVLYEYSGPKYFVTGELLHITKLNPQEASLIITKLGDRINRLEKELGELKRGKKD